MKPFLAELKRRKVVRVAIVYVVVGLVVVEAANNLLPALNLPDWTVTLVVALTILGFPVAVALAWAFDITPEGVVRTPALEADQEEAPSAAVAVRPAPERSEDLKSIAVLPFADMSPDHDQEYFGDGVAEEVLNVMTRIPDLQVAARTSSFSFKDKGCTVQEIARELGVATVLEGSVRKAGDRLRITAQLTEAPSGFHLWSETYERELEDIFAIQDEIARAITDTLRVTLLGEQDEPLVKVATKDPGAYDLYLKGRHCWVRRYKVGLQTALQYFQKAIERDPEYALPYTGIADVHTIFAIYGLLDPAEAQGVAEKAAERAMALDPDLPEAHFSKALIRNSFHYDWEKGDGSLKRAVELNPDFAAAHAWRGIALVVVGVRVDEGFEYARQACALDPHSSYIWGLAGLANLLGGRYEEALEHLEQALELEPEDILALWVAGTCYSAVGRHAEAIATMEKAVALSHRMAHLVGLLGAAYGRAGMMTEAQAMLEELRERAGREYISPAAMAWACANIGLPEDALRYLEQALADSKPSLCYTIRFPLWDAILSDPRYTAVVTGIGFEPWDLSSPS
ncbi:MAG: tetratricopeptide repeat protein [Gemmatimonadetes bacterium]|nr:tetratricopeptide repeat protein [Gemmatimonadota bacterium]NIO32809.1 tetratricopeptide repeat protein [Gemmatimonadota bacterium]